MHAINLQYILFAQTVQGCTQGMHVFQVCMYMCCIHEHTFLQLLVVCCFYCERHLLVALFQLSSICCV